MGFSLDLGDDNNVIRFYLIIYFEYIINKWENVKFLGERSKSRIKCLLKAKALIFDLFVVLSGNQLYLRF